MNWAHSNWLLSCCDVPASNYIDGVLFSSLCVCVFVVLFFVSSFHKGKANKIKENEL